MQCRRLAGVWHRCRWLWRISRLRRRCRISCRCRIPWIAWLCWLCWRLCLTGVCRELGCPRISGRRRGLRLTGVGGRLRRCRHRCRIDPLLSIRIPNRLLDGLFRLSGLSRWYCLCRRNCCWCARRRGRRITSLRRGCPLVRIRQLAQWPSLNPGRLVIPLATPRYSRYRVLSISSFAAIRLAIAIELRLHLPKSHFGR